MLWSWTSKWSKPDSIWKISMSGKALNDDIEIEVPKYEDVEVQDEDDIKIEVKPEEK